MDIPCINGMTNGQYFGGILTELGMTGLYEKLWYKPNAEYKYLGSPDNPQSSTVHESIIFFRKGAKRRIKPEGVLSPSDVYYNKFVLPNVWSIPLKDLKGIDTSIHPCPFPIDLSIRLIYGFSYYGEVILDPFAGCCVLPIIASMMGRKAYAFEESDVQIDSVRRIIAAIEQAEKHGESFWNIELPDDGGLEDRQSSRTKGSFLEIAV